MYTYKDTMIAVTYRFHGHGSLRYLFMHAEAVRSRAVVLKFIANKKRRQSRFAVIVSKKVHKSAVGRNRIRRRLYEIVRTEQPKFSATYDAALIVTSAEVRTMPAEELRQSVQSLFARAGMY